MRVKCLAQEHNTMTRPGLEPGPLDPESSALTTRPPRLPLRATSLSVLLPSSVTLNKVYCLIDPPYWGLTNFATCGYSVKVRPLFT